MIFAISNFIKKNWFYAMLFKKAKMFIFKLSIEGLDKKIGQKLEKISQFTFMTLIMDHPVYYVDGNRS